MFGRLLGYYTLRDLFSFWHPDHDVEKDIKEFLPLKPAYFYGAGRQALFAALEQIGLKGGRGRYIAIPSWGCPIVLAVVARAGFKPLLFDVSPYTLHMDISQIISAVDKYELAAAILVAENGLPYGQEEVKPLRDAGLAVIGDYAVGWQNIAMLREIETDFEIFSGGFSKPISGMGLGVMTTHWPVSRVSMAKSLSSVGDWLKLVLHLFLQRAGIYGFARPLLPNDLELDYNGTQETPSSGSVNIALNSLRRFREFESDWRNLQSNIRTILQSHGSRSAVVDQYEPLQTKIAIESSLVSESHSREMEFHHQYTYDLMADPRSHKLDCQYEMTQELKEDFISFAINGVAIQNSHRFLDVFDKALCQID